MHLPCGYSPRARTARPQARLGDAEDLAETAHLAESGSIILDTTSFQERDERAAAAILALMDNPDVPEFITQALVDALTLAEDVIGINYASRGRARFVPDALANLVTSSRGRDIKREAPDFAEMLSAVLRHPEVPMELYNAIADLDCMTPSRWDTPGNIREALRQYAQAGHEGDALKGGASQ